MKKLLLTLVTAAIFTFGFGQTGDLATSIDFVRDVQCVTYNLNLSKSDTTLHYSRVKSYDTLTEIPVGLYTALFYSCDSNYTYSQKIEIVEDEVRFFNFRSVTGVNTMYNNDVMYSNAYYDEYYDSLYSPQFFGVHMQFSRGIDYNAEYPNLLNNFAFDYLFGHDVLLTKPVALGYEIGFGYTQVNYISEDLEDPTISHEKQRFTTFDISFAAVTSIYVNNNRMLTLGGRYRLPYFSRWARVTGNEKISTKGLHKFNDFSVFAQLGYDWGFLFAEYRFDQFLRAPLGDLPNLSIGVRISIADEW
jgi:hypothetical protein